MQMMQRACQGWVSDAAGRRNASWFWVQFAWIGSKLQDEADEHAKIGEIED
jgi:hypothetical protein